MSYSDNGPDVSFLCDGPQWPVSTLCSWGWRSMPEESYHQMSHWWVLVRCFVEVKASTSDLMKHFLSLIRCFVFLVSLVEPHTWGGLILTHIPWEEKKAVTLPWEICLLNKAWKTTARSESAESLHSVIACWVIYLFMVLSWKPLFMQREDSV